MKPDKPVARTSDIRFDACPLKDVAEKVRAWHYSKSISNATVTFCGRDVTTGEIVSVVGILPPSRPSAKKYAQTTPEKVIGIHRVVVAPGQPTNVASMAIGDALRRIRRARRYDTVITYADTAQGHTGAIYRATNATCLGMSRPEAYWVDAHGRHVSRKATKSRTAAEMRAAEYTRLVSPGKHIFVWRF